ncbi:hypothetical protein [Roseomonas indoligenes]|uniref:Uncharacterized protein n=1 Tax=Roseomonas indoligenes TaxID=2820811 RepID=A0A940N2R0_9PROT|nr:hypothetical protein [Pararoseomonas indoligenes]MBP0495662.1 hypothetical protein [Pararoseomonas indoligenes]
MAQGSKGRDAGHDPGDSVPPGVAPVNPVPLTEEDLKVKRKLEELGGGKPIERGPQGQAETDGPERIGR